MSDFSSSSIRFPDKDRVGRNSSNAPVDDRFKKVMAKEEQPDNPFREKEVKEKKRDKVSGNESSLAASRESETKKGAHPNLFELSGGKGEEDLVEEPTDEIAAEDQSLSVLFGNSKSGKKKVANRKTSLPDIAEIPIIPQHQRPTVTETPKKESSTRSTQFIPETADISQVNPMTELPKPFSLGPVPVTNVPAGYSSASAEDIQKIVDQIVQKLYIVAEKGQTDTTVVLKHPPLFEGATVILTSFQSARGEFNIRFENLTLMAKNMLDLPEMRHSLKTTLEDKGFIVHIITTTTLQETPSIIEGDALSRERRREGREKEKESQQQQKQKE